MRKVVKRPRIHDRRWSNMYDWHIAMGCTPCSPACLQCASARWLGNKPVAAKLINWVKDCGVITTLLGERRTVPVFNGTVRLFPDNLVAPLTLKPGAQVFVCGCSDAFHDSVPFDYMAGVIWIIEQRPDLVFFLISRRLERALEFCKWLGRELPRNLWIGTSAEDQEKYDKRAAYLCEMPAKHRGMSLKPLMGPIVIDPVKQDFVIVGGQSGLGAMPMHPKWAGSIRDQCVSARVAFQFHQWGAWSPYCAPTCSAEVWLSEDGNVSATDNGGILMHRVGSKNSGLKLDGVEWDQYPDTQDEHWSEPVHPWSVE